VKSLILILVLCLGLFLQPGAALAHAVETYYQVTPNTVETASSFSTGEVFHDAPVVIFAPGEAETPWLEGTTDTDGKFVMQPDLTVTGDWSIEIGEGSHWDRVEVPVSDRGIELESVSYIDGHHPHFHFSNQFMVAGIAIGAGLGSRFLRRTTLKS
jgi:nickel transport protein